jgi:hypothetical protein
MATTGGIQVTVTGGTPSASMTGTTLVDGTYTLTIQQDGGGISAACVTPYGTFGQDDFQKGDAIE